MVPKWLKAIQKSPYESQLQKATDNIILWDFRWLDIKKIRWKFGMYRCRVWDYRIIFEEVDDGKYKILHVGGRGDIYKNI